MGLLRRPTPGDIVEGGRLGRPRGPGAHSRAIPETRLRLRRQTRIAVWKVRTVEVGGCGVCLAVVAAQPSIQVSRHIVERADTANS
jgi:hypothetical protein